MNRVAFGLAATCAAMLGTAAPAPAEPGGPLPGSGTVQVGSLTTTVSVTLNAATGVATPAVPTGSARGAAVQPTPTESAFVRAINETRRERGLAPLTVNHDLVRAARFHSADMVDRGYFEHGSVSRRLTRFGIKTGTVGENLGWRSSRKSAVPMLIDMWLRSPSHRAILLRPQFRSVGVGTGIGQFRGWDNAIVVTVDFWSG
jgi:uncharacterized protein YkwD